MTKTQRAATNEAIENMGGVVETAALFGISSQGVALWRKRGVPLKHLKKVLARSKVKRERLRPDLYA